MQYFFHKLIGITLFACIFTSGLAASPTTNDSIVALEVPKMLDADLNNLLNEWHKGYSCRTLSSNPSTNKGRTIDVRTQSDSVIIANLDRLPTVIPLHYNPIIKEAIATFSTDRTSLICTMLTLGDYYFPQMEAVLDQYKVPVELMYLTIVESALNPFAVSPVGASGIWQFMLPTAKAYGLEINSFVDERLDVVRSTHAAARYFKDMYRLYGDWLLAIAAYNCGPGNINKAIRRSGGQTDFWSIYPYLPRETRNYVPLFIGVYYAMYHHNEYYIAPIERVVPLATDTLQLSYSLSFDEIATITGLKKEQIARLNPQYKKEVILGYQPFNVLTLPIKELSLIDLAGDSLASIDRSKVEIKEPVTVTASKKKDGSRNRSSKTYTIRKGDTLSRIASRHGVSLNQLKKANGIKSNRHKLIPGKKLKIPAR